MSTNNTFKHFLLFFLLFISIAFAFEVHDEDSLIKIPAGQGLVKYVSIYNFQNEKEILATELLLEDYPEKQKPAYQVDLAMLKDKTIEILPQQKLLYPVYINAYKRLGRGRYVYWLRLSKQEYEFKKEDVDYVARQVYKLPIIIVVE